MTSCIVRNMARLVRCCLALLLISTSASSAQSQIGADERLRLLNIAVKLSQDGGENYKKGNLDGAVIKLGMARIILHRIQEHESEGQTLASLGLVYLSKRDLKKACDSFRDAGAAYAKVKKVKNKPELDEVMSVFRGKCAKK
jgi:hypothetical protein